MNWKVIKTEAAYQKAVKRTMVIFQAKEGTPEADELALLLLPPPRRTSDERDSDDIADGR